MLGTASVLAAGDFCIATRSLALQREFELPIVQGISLDAARVSKLGLVPDALHCRNQCFSFSNLIPFK